MPSSARLPTTGARDRIRPTGNAAVEVGTAQPATRNIAVEVGIVLLATVLVAVLPAVAATELVGSRDAVSIALSTGLAVVLSIAAARAGLALWSHRRRSTDLLFSDLMLWNWLHRRWTERRFAALRRRLASVRDAETSMPLRAYARMSQLLEARDARTYGHSRRVSRYARSIARGLQCDADEVETIRQAALLHDVGKLHTPPGILNKAGRLTDDEFAVVKRHAVDGAAMLTGIGDPTLVAMVRHHHERLDGCGYPNGLRGDQIPLGARIIAVADTFDALTSARPYRERATHKRALEILVAEAGTQLDADAVSVFQQQYSGRRPIAVATTVSAASDRMFSWISGWTTGVGNGIASLAHALPIVGTVAMLSVASGSASTNPTTRPVDPTSSSSAGAYPRSAMQRTPGNAITPSAPSADSGPDEPQTTTQPITTVTQGTITPTAATSPSDPPPVSGIDVQRLPAVSTPTVSTPAVSTPTVTTPAVSTPVADIPSVTIPPVSTSVVIAPAD